MKKKQKPEFSIVIALAPWRDAEILSSIKNLDYPKRKFEVIIKKGLNVSDNRNNGALEANGQFIVFLDDDGVIEKDFLRKVDSFFKKYPKVDILGGPQLTPHDDSFFGKVSGYALGSRFATGQMFRRYTKAPLNLEANSNYTSGANLTCKKKVFEKIKFDRTFYPGDDTNFVNLAKINKLNIAYSPEIFIYHRRRPTVKSLIKQIFDYGCVRSSERISEEIFNNPSFIVPSAFLLYILILPPLSLISLLFILPLIIYILSDIVFSVYAGIKNKNLSSIPLLLLIFFIIHLSYGAGFIKGLISRIGKKNERA